MTGQDLGVGSFQVIARSDDGEARLQSGIDKGLYNVEEQVFVGDKLR